MSINTNGYTGPMRIALVTAIEFIPFLPSVSLNSIRSELQKHHVGPKIPRLFRISELQSNTIATDVYNQIIEEGVVKLMAEMLERLKD